MEAPRVSLDPPINDIGHDQRDSRCSQVANAVAPTLDPGHGRQHHRPREDFESGADSMPRSCPTSVLLGQCDRTQ